MSQDLVSIVTPSYNTAKFIGETIRSVRAQTYTNWELLIVDDCSTDGTVKVLPPYIEGDSRIKLFVNEKNSGAAVLRNRALREATGHWIAFLDSDDLWEPTKLEKQIRFMEDKGCSFSYTSYCEMSENRKETGAMVSGPKKISKSGMFAFCWPGCLTVMYDASVVGLVQIEDIKKNNDYAMWLKVCKKADCYLLDECLAKYRRGRAGSISSHSILTMIRWHYRLFKDAEHENVVSAMWHTCINLVCGFYKKLRYIKQYEVCG